MKFDILYYVIGILYLIFDLEIIFLFPLASVMFSLGSLIAFWIVMAFLIILTIGFIYEYNQGALDIVLIIYSYYLIRSCIKSDLITSNHITLFNLSVYPTPLDL
jgi:NADH:ubiquinone oxidoreductase subunit 3 (subunit A)